MPIWYSESEVEAPFITPLIEELNSADGACVVASHPVSSVCIRIHVHILHYFTTLKLTK